MKKCDIIVRWDTDRPMNLHGVLQYDNQTEA